jgi:hypothetical protein
MLLITTIAAQARSTQFLRDYQAQFMFDEGEDALPPAEMATEE